MSEALKELGALLELKRRDCVLSQKVAFDELTVDVSPNKLVSFVEFLLGDSACKFSTLVDITAVDYPGRAKRFDVIYHFLSMYTNQRIRLRVSIREDEMVPSIIVRDPLFGPPRPAPDPDRLWLPRPSAAQGFPDHRLYRGPLRRSAKARCLRACLFGAGIPSV